MTDSSDLIEDDAEDVSEGLSVLYFKILYGDFPAELEKPPLCQFITICDPIDGWFRDRYLVGYPGDIR